MDSKRPFTAANDEAGSLVADRGVAGVGTGPHGCGAGDFVVDLVFRPVRWMGGVHDCWPPGLLDSLKRFPPSARADYILDVRTE